MGTDTRIDVASSSRCKLALLCNPVLDPVPGWVITYTGAIGLCPWSTGGDPRSHRTEFFRQTYRFTIQSLWP